MGVINVTCVHCVSGPPCEYNWKIVKIKLFTLAGVRVHSVSIVRMEAKIVIRLVRRGRILRHVRNVLLTVCDWWSGDRNK